jgi:hypothetical protein
VGVRFGPENEKPSFSKEKVFLINFKLGDIFIVLKQSTKRKFLIIPSLILGQEVSKTEGEPTRKWTGEGNTHPGVAIEVRHLA